MCVLRIACYNQGGFFSPWIARILVSSIVLMLSLPLPWGSLAKPSTSTCQHFVKEWDSLNCTCQGNCDDSSTPTFTWQKVTSTVSMSVSLVKTNVRRQDNGTQFTCRMKCKTETDGRATYYTLQVSYGPTSEHLMISATGSTVVGANSALNLTCLATEFPPAPVYTMWDGPCDRVQGNTCSFVPQREHDGQTMTCRALTADSKSSVLATATFTLNLTYPPTDPPVIQGYAAGQILIAGDMLSCTVTGGKPLVQSVHFSCDGYPDQNDSTSQSSLTSKVIMSESWITEGTANCTCTAYWPLLPDLYLINSTRSVTEDEHYTEPFLESKMQAAVISGVVGCVVLVAFCLVIWWRECKKTQSVESRDHVARKTGSSTQGRSYPAFSEDDHDNDDGIDEKDSPPLHMSATKPDFNPFQHQLDAGYVDADEFRDGVRRKKSARGQAYEVTSLVKEGSARIGWETTKPPATNSNGGYAEPWRDFNVDMPDGQPSMNKAPAHTTATRAGNNASPDHYTGPCGEEYASVGGIGKGGNKKTASLKPTDKTGTAAKPAAVNTGNSAGRTSGDGYAKMDECSGQNPGAYYYTKVHSNQKSKPPHFNVRADRQSEMDTSGPAFDSPGYSTVAQSSRDKGNKTSSGKEMHSGAESTDARGSDIYDHFSRQGQQSRPLDPTYAHTHDF